MLLLGSHHFDQLVSDGMVLQRAQFVLLFILVQVAACESLVLAQAAESLTAKVTKGDLAIDVELPGIFVAEDKDELAMEPAEYRGDLIVTKIMSEGSLVKEGDVLMEFDVDKLERALEEAEDKKIDADVEMKKAEAERKSAEIDHATALGQLEKELQIAEKKLAAAQEKANLALEEKEKQIKDA